MQTKPIEIDLRRDLPKVRENWRALMRALPKMTCRYSAPCVIGSMLDQPSRRWLGRNEDLNTKVFRGLLNSGLAFAPPDQIDDLEALQISFDEGEREPFEDELARIEAKYLAA